MWYRTLQTLSALVISQRDLSTVRMFISLLFLVLRGASAVVKIAKHKGTKKDYAIKMITKTVSETTRFPFSRCTFKAIFIGHDCIPPWLGFGC